MSRVLTPASFARQPLDGLLDGTGRVRVLRALLRHGGFLSVSRIASEAGMTPQGVRQVLAALDAAGVLSAIRAGKGSVYAAVDSHPLVKALASLFAAEHGRFENMLAAISAAASPPQVMAAWVFGSVARGEDRVGSDFDVAFVLDVGAEAVEDMADRLRRGLCQDGERLGFGISLVGVTGQDVRRLAADRHPLWCAFERDAMVLKGLDPVSLERILRRGNRAAAVPLV